MHEPAEGLQQSKYNAISNVLHLNLYTMYIHICRHGEDTYIHDYAHMLNIYTILYIHYVYTMIYIIYIYIYTYILMYI